MAARIILALDFGGTKLAAGVLDQRAGCWLARDQCATPAAKGAEGVLACMLALANAQLAAAGARPAAVGGSVDGPVDVASGEPRLSHHVPGWEHTPLRMRVAEHFGAPAILDNDANIAALGEWRYGAGRGTHDMLYLTVSTGVGGGLVLNGALYRGLNGLAGEIGHMHLEDDGPLCPCGRRGCLEALAAGPAIARRASELLAVMPAAPSALRGRDHLTAQEIARAAQEGDSLASRALQGAAHSLGIAIGNALNLLNLERVVIGGGVTRSGEDYLAWVRQAANETALAGIEVNIALAELGGDAPLWGACALAETLL